MCGKMRYVCSFKSKGKYLIHVSSRSVTPKLDQENKMFINKMFIMMNNQDTNFSIAVKTMPMCWNVQTKCEYVGEQGGGKQSRFTSLLYQ